MSTTSMLKVFPWTLLTMGICLFCLNLHGEEPENASDTRDLILVLAEDGSPEAYALFEEILTDPKEVQKIYAGFGGGRLGHQQIGRAIHTIGNRQDQDSFDLLVRLINDPVARGEASRYAPLIENLLKFRDTHTEEVLDVFEEQLFLPQNEIDQIIEQYPFVADPNVTRERPGSYTNQEGELIHRSRIFPYSSGSHRAVRGLSQIDTPRSWDMLAKYLNSYPGLELGGSGQLTNIDLRLDRYRPEVITIYEVVAKNEMRSPKDRAVAIASFFDNIQRSTYSQTLPQIADAPEESLLRILDFANYALTLDFLPHQQRALGYSPDPTPIVDIIYQKRLETIQRLEALGYDPEWLRAPGLKAGNAQKEVSTELVTEEPTNTEEAFAIPSDPAPLTDESKAPIPPLEPAGNFPWLPVILGFGAAALLVYFLCRRRG